MKPNNCTQILNILAERKNKIYKDEHFDYIRNSRSTNCSQVINVAYKYNYVVIPLSLLPLYPQGLFCCEFDLDDAKRQLLNQDCGKFESYKGYEDKEIKLMSRPWMTLLKFRNKHNGSIEYSCVGSLIHKRMYKLYKKLTN